MKKRTYPEIRIKNAWLLYTNASVHLHKLLGKKGKLTSIKDVDKIVGSYQKAWLKYEKVIMEGMLKTTGLKFHQNTIDVYIAPWFSAFSDPIVIGIKYQPDNFVDVLTHELLHRLLTDNTQIGSLKLMSKWKTLFGKRHTFGTIVHIPVHAIHKAIYLDILKQPSRLQREIDDMETFKAIDYIKSWNYVQKNDYKRIIKSLLAIYKK
jgi:antirestriction protein ArdC